MSANVRAYLLEQLDLPEEWRKIDEQRIPDVIDRPTVIVKHDHVEPLRDAPLGSLSHDLLLAVFIPNRDLARAEKALDDSLVELLTALAGHASISWTEAQKVVTPNGQYPGWEVRLSAITQRTS